MKIGITGATGFLGSAIVEEAKARGWSPVAFSRDSDASVPGADEVRASADRERIDLSGLDGVIHLAGEPIVGLWTRNKRQRIRDSRVDLTAGLVEAIAGISRSRRPAAFVSASAVGFYGDRGDEWLDEDSDGGFGFLPDVCREWEAAAAEASRLGCRVVNPRIGLVLGRGGLLARLRPLFRMWSGGRLGSGKQWMSWIHRRDAARIFADCVAESGIRGRVNCVAPNPVTNREFTRAYAQVLERKAMLPAPEFLLRRLPGGMGRLFLDSQRADPVMMKAFGFEWEFPELEAALREIEEGERTGS